MHENAILLTLALALAVVTPIAAAEPLETAPLTPVGLAEPLALDPTGLAGNVLDEGIVQVDETLDLAVAVDVQTDAAREPVPTPDATATQPSRGEPARTIGERAAEAAAPAAGAALVAVLMGALALGLDGLRMLQGRVSGLLGRVLRAVAGAALVAVPLFSRIERGQVMDNPIRARVHEVIAAEPGLSLSDVSQRAGIAWGTTVHHLRRLETLGLVVSVLQRPHRRYFVANTATAAQRTAVAVVMHPTARRIAEFVTQRPGTDQAGICQALGLNNPSASKHLSRFEAGGLVLSLRSGRNRHYHATGGLHSALLLLDPARGTTTMVATPPLLALHQGA
ncbi:MAG: winged helix-turn-helix transcriptional regulator [Candidatus Thermoplasmatota archaeon]|jgi:predicted transcriptional regulator